MQKVTSAVVVFLIILLLGSSIVLWADSDFYPIPSTNDQTIPGAPGEPAITNGQNLSVQRNHVLLEIFTGTW